MSEPAQTTDSGITVEVKDYALGHISEAAAARIAERLMPKVGEMIEKRLDAILDNAWQASIQAKAQEAIDVYLTKPRHKTNGWGEPISGATEALADRIPKAVEEYMTQRVDSRGQHDPHYSRGDKSPTRLDWMLQTLVVNELKKETEKAAKDVTEKARVIVANHVGRFISEQMVPAIEVGKN